MKVSELGEFGLIERLKEGLAARPAPEPAGRLAAGIGDDAAAWRADGEAILATTDTLVEGVHFLSDRTAWRDLGWKVLAVNVSDIAAMGGVPEFALVTLALPGDTEVEAVDALYAGLGEAGAEYGVAIAGGDIVRSPVAAITVALTGRAELDESGEPRILRRSAARAGDLVAVTGRLGGAAGGLQMLQGGATETDTARALAERHMRPQARVQAGQAALEAGVRCAIDISDGLLKDLGHICEQSGLGAVVWRDKLPIDSALPQAFDPEQSLRLAATGGEDYELLLAGEQRQIEEAGRHAGVPLTVIGEMVIGTERRASLLDEAGREMEMPASGWDHLRGP